MRLASLFLTLLLFASSAIAQLNGDGYYRIRNSKTKRYAYITDNKGELNYSTTTADMNAIQLWLGFEKASSDPATVCYIKNVESNKYDIQGQGTGLYEMLKATVTLRERNGVYLAYASKEGLTKYLSDGEHAEGMEQGVMSGEGTGEWRNWDIIPLSLNDEAYFGVKPTINLNGQHYAPFYADFPFSFASSGMKAMYISKVDNGMAVYKEITGTIPGETPMFIQCSSDQPVNNKLNIGGTASSVSGNKLKGVYFDNKTKKHYNRTAYDPETMRLLGVMSNGKLGFIKSSIDFIPANTCYLTVAAGSPNEIAIISEQEYNDYLATIPTSISLSSTSLALTEGDTATLQASVAPSTAQTTLTWVSSNSSVATVSNGNITAIAPGDAKITVTTHNGLSASCTVSVKQKEVPVTAISFDKTSIELTEGVIVSIGVSISPANATNKILSWSSSNPDAATVDKNGQITAMKAGETNITATTTDGSNLSATCKVVVVKPIVLAQSISLDKTSMEVEAPAEFTLTATVLPDDVTNKSVKWESNNTAVATVDNNGNVKVIAAGEAIITATTTDGTKLTASCTIKAVDPVIIAQSISLSQSSIDVKVPAEFTLSAIVLPANTTNKAVKWESDNTEVATVDDNGNVKVISYGKATITATTTDGSNLSASCNVITADEVFLAESITLDQTAIEVEIPAEFTLTATILPEKTSNKGVKWTSSNVEIATVDDKGNVKVIAEGEVTITATTTDGTNLSASCTITAVKPVIFAESISLNFNSKNVVAPFEFMLIATVLPDNTTNKEVKWESNNAEVATVDDDGNVKVLTNGDVIITATTLDGSNLSAQCIINAVAGIEAIFTDENSTLKVYSITGAYIRTITTADELKQLSPGVYIINKQKVIIR